MRIVALTLLLATAACTTPFEARVNRFSALPAPQGQTFAIQARDQAKAGSLEFATYANLVGQRLTAQGYSAAATPGAASLIVQLDYAVSPPREKIETRQGLGYYGGFGGYRGGFGGWGGYGGFGARGRFGGFYGGGFYGPGFWDPFWGPTEVYSTTQYNSFVALRIDRTADKESVFEGRAETVSRSGDLTRLVPPLVDALFTGFPGNSGETIRVRLPEQRQKVMTYAPG
ncbi:DUF4136 domain-containing protein [Glacieibacterium frigidum]|uniref:DUF4136 domain-containing protein n=1 Tax=Glacieibacterium frigidum TaxID=2593303 RepID=A0A552U9L9_9SPHN|nr:DUF4136 domain-containing protein [Glacieibacterium frigidum]TRW14889.1 DUF4136 domain-containing protein [Glacieibacterium frigidum]